MTLRERAIEFLNGSKRTDLNTRADLNLLTEAIRAELLRAAETADRMERMVEDSCGAAIAAAIRKQAE